MTRSEEGGLRCVFFSVKLSKNYLDNINEVTFLIDRKSQLESKKNELLEKKPNYYNDKEESRIAKLPLPKKVLAKIHSNLPTKNNMKKVGFWTTILIALQQFPKLF